MIVYKRDLSFSKEDVQRLFLSVEWHSGNYPDMLYKALRNYPTLITAYDGDKLIGLSATMDDGIMNAYIHYLLVDPEYQGQGIGKKLMEMTNEVYKDYVNVVLISYNDKIEFYEKCNYYFNTEQCAMRLNNGR